MDKSLHAALTRKGGGDLVLEEIERRDGHRQNYWVRPEGAGSPGSKDPEAKVSRATERAASRQAESSSAKRHELLLEGSAKSPAAAPPSPAGEGVDSPPQLELASPLAEKAAKEMQDWDAPTWKAASVHAGGKFHPAVDKALLDMTKKMHEGLALNPGKEKLVGFGVKAFRIGSLKGAHGSFVPGQDGGTINVTHQVAQELHDAIAAGKVRTSAQFHAFEVVAHEAGHACSRMHEYEGITGAPGKNGKPHAAMEEATTEVVGQHYAESFMKGFGLKVELDDGPGPFGLQYANGGPMFVYDKATDAPRATVPMAYYPMVRNLAAFASVAEDTKTPEQLHNATVNWATTLKKTRGGLRFERLADRMLEGRLERDEDDDLYRGAVEYAVSKGGALPVKNPPPFTAARQELAEHLRFLMGTGKAVRIGMLKDTVKQIAAKHKKGK